MLLAGAVVGVLACEEPKEIGLSPTTPVDVSFTDTLTVTRETIRFDSTRSNDQSNLMVGRYTDPVFGKIQARAFVQMVPQVNFVVNDSATTNATPASRIVYDSTRLFLNYDAVSYGDTTMAQELQVWRLRDSLNSSINYDISSTVATTAQPLVRQTIRPRPNTTDSLSFRLSLPDALGQELIQLANTEAGKVANGALFRAQVRGLMLTTTGNDRAAVVGFRPGGSAVVVYFHVQGERTAKLQVFLLSGKRFNQVLADRSGTPLANLQRGGTLPVTATNGRSFVQPASGITTKLMFPTLNRFIQQGRLAINRADLIITPANPDDATLYNPPALALAEVDEKNQLRRVPTTGSGTTTTGGFPFLVPFSGPIDRNSSSFANPQIIRRVVRTNNYTFNISGYMQSVVTGLSPNTGLAILSPGAETLFPRSQFGVTDATQLYLNDRLWRMVIDGQASVRLVLFYTSSK
ncbi:hypothetical protein AWR27_15765 [Spirosoma montaniterrae]|uniref:DUF4270 domain-containing protein n=1 Tax=Spirosoma montaniterrae TaxID=1178516 RepID=A0A1P9WZ63_9BACT|nr:hypothetical protein AWR27_15765 [Spirosoma montaniterrae]